MSHILLGVILGGAYKRRVVCCFFNAWMGSQFEASPPERCFLKEDSAEQQLPCRYRFCSHPASTGASLSVSQFLHKQYLFLNPEIQTKRDFDSRICNLKHQRACVDQRHPFFKPLKKMPRLVILSKEVSR